MPEVLLIQNQPVAARIVAQPELTLSSVMCGCSASCRTTLVIAWVCVTGDESTREINVQAAIHLLVEVGVEVEVIQRLLQISELYLLLPALQQTFTAARQFVRD